MNTITRIITKTFIGLAFFGGLFALAPQAQAYVSFNKDPQDYPTVEVTNYTDNPNCASCWSSSVSADPGDVVSVEFYYHNTGNDVARGTRLKLSPTGAASTHTLTGSVFAQNGGSAANTVTVNINGGAQTLTVIPGSARWYPNHSPFDATRSNYTSLPGGQSGAEVFGSGISIGDIAPGWSTAGTLVLRLQVSGSPQTQQYACSNGVDDDGDGLIDMNDPGCTSATDNSEYNATATYACSNGIDDDGDGLIDMNDPGCTSPTDTSEYNTQSYHACSNGVDDDGDGLIDMNDPGCESSNDDSEYNATTNITAYTDPATNITDDRATLNGHITASGYYSGGVTYWFQYGNNPSLLSHQTSHRTYNSGSNVNAVISGLAPNSTYYFRLAAENNHTGSIHYGQVRGFTTEGTVVSVQPPVAVTTVATSVGSSSARLNGFILIHSALPTSSWFEWGTSTALGNGTSVKQIGTAPSVNVSEFISGLAPNTTYYFRAAAQNSAGTSYGRIESFRTGSVGTQQVVVRNVTTVVGGTASPIVALEIEPRFPQGSVGDQVEYSVRWENLTTKDLTNVVLRVQLPREVAYQQASAGQYNETEHILTLTIGVLPGRAKGEIFIQGEILPTARSREMLVATAIIVYSPTPGVPEETLDYGIITMRDANLLGAAALFGGGFFPNSLIGWLILILLLLALVMLARQMSRRKTVTSTTTTTAFEPPHRP